MGLIKILAIDVGIILSGVFGIKTNSIHSVTNNSHALTVFFSFARELETDLRSKVEYTVCGQRRNLDTETLDFCVDYAIKHEYKFVLIPYHGGTRFAGEQEIIKKGLKNGLVFILPAGNNVAHDVRLLEPHKYCINEKNCFIVSNPLNNSFRHPKITIDIPAIVCLNDNECYTGSSLSVGRFAAMLVNGGGKYDSQDK